MRVVRTGIWAALAVLLLVSVTQASPLMNVRLQPVTINSVAVAPTDWSDGKLIVQAGDVVGYELQFKFSSIGTVNTTANPDKTLLSLVSTKDNLTQARVDVKQAVDAAVQVDFVVATNLSPWTGTGTAPGVLTARGMTGNDDLLTVTGTQPATPYAGAGTFNNWAAWATGSFTVTEAPLNSDGVIQLTQATGGPGAFKMNGAVISGVVTAPANDASAADPYFSFTGLTLTTVPEPMTLALLTLGGGLVAIRRRRR